MKSLFLCFVLLSISMRLTGASELRKNKNLLIFYTFLDYDKDNNIDDKDIDSLVEGVRAQRWYSEEGRYKLVGEMWHGFHKGMVKETKDKNGKISVQQWLAFWDDYAKNTSVMKNWQRLYEQAIFETVDFNMDGVITEDEFVSAYNNFYNDQADVSAAFQKMAKGGDTVTKTDYHQLFVEFFSSDDPEAPGSFITGTTKLNNRY